jgi:hypothetical protein
VAALAFNIRMVGLSLAEGNSVLLRCEAGARSDDEKVMQMEEWIALEKGLI